MATGVLQTAVLLAPSLLQHPCWLVETVNIWREAQQIVHQTFYLILD